MDKLNFSDTEYLAKVLEAVLLAADKPMSIQRLADLFDEETPPSHQQLAAALQVLKSHCQQRSYQLTEVASGFRLQIRTEYSPWVGRLWEERPQRYSRAMLETLALIAYRQPITRGEIEDVRGVAVNSQIIKTLMEREWVRVVGYKEVPGRPAMLATTKAFLDYFNLRALDELPSLIELQALQANAEQVQTTTDSATAQQSANISSVADGEDTASDDKQELSFGSLLAELESMEQGLTTDFIDPVQEDSATEAAHQAQDSSKKS